MTIIIAIYIPSKNCAYLVSDDMSYELELGFNLKRDGASYEKFVSAIRGIDRYGHKIIHIKNGVLGYTTFEAVRDNIKDDLSKLEKIDDIKNFSGISALLIERDESGTIKAYDYFEGEITQLDPTSSGIVVGCHSMLFIFDFIIPRLATIVYREEIITEEELLAFLDYLFHAISDQYPIIDPMFYVMRIDAHGYEWLQKRILAGGGKVLLDSSGIHIKGERIWLRNLDGDLVGIMGVQEYDQNNVFIKAESGKSVYIVGGGFNSELTVSGDGFIRLITGAGSDIVLLAGGKVNFKAHSKPDADLTYDLGESSKRFKDLYVQRVKSDKLLGILSTGGGSDISSGVTAYYGHSLPTWWSTTESQVQCPLPKAGTIRNLYVRVRSNNCIVASSVRVRKNGVDTDIVVAIPPSSTGTFSDTVNTADFAAGDLLSFKAIAGADTGSLSIQAITVEVY